MTPNDINEQDETAANEPDNDQDDSAVTSTQDPNESLKLDEDEIAALLYLQKQIELEDQGVRITKLAQWRKLELYFNNITDLFWNEDARDWRIPNWDTLDLSNSDIPPRTIAIYRAHAETIIAALSVEPPKVIFTPDDADNADDIDTAETYNVTAQMIQLHNKSKLLIMKILQILFNQGTCFAYNYVKRDMAYGHYTQPIFAEVDSESYESTCPDCGYDLGEFPAPPTDNANCPACGKNVKPDVTKVPYKITLETGKERIPKHRILIDAFGPLNIKTSFYARNQKQVGYITLKFDENIAYLREAFTTGKDAILDFDDIQANTADAPFDSQVRYSPDYYGAQPMNTAVVKCSWFRTWMLNLVDSVETRTKLKTRFPNGIYVIFINDQIAEHGDENLDDHWTISEDPLSNFVHGEPLGTNLAIAQDVRSEAFELRLQTMEHSITETFVDASILDKDKYEATRSAPGLITPVKRNPGESLSASFFETRTASMSEEANQMIGAIDADAQFATGSLPSVFGGDDNPGGLTPVTATQYATSKAQALKRLNIVWQRLCYFWADIIHKSTVDFLNSLTGDNDYSYSQKVGENNYKNIFIRKSALRGKIGSVEAVGADQLPLDWAEKRGVITNLLQMKDDTIKAVLLHPENSEIMKQIIGIPEFYVPGNDSRNRQYREILELLASEPMMGKNNQPQSSLLPEETDDHKTHMIICAAWLSSPQAWEVKKQETMSGKPGGFTNVSLHYTAHEQALMRKTIQPSGNTPEGQEPDSGSPNMVR